MVDKTIERIIKIPRVRICDCQRLIFRLGENPVWRDIDSDPDLFPIYPMPPMIRKEYTLGGYQISVTQDINGVVRQICEVLRKEMDERTYLHTMIFKKSGDLEIQTETI